MMEVSLLLCMYMRILTIRAKLVQIDGYGDMARRRVQTYVAQGHPRGLSLLAPRFRPSEIGHPPLETPITLVLYPALSGFTLRPATLTRCRIDVAIKIRLEWDWRIRMPFCPTRWLVRGDGIGGLPLKLFEFALLLCREGMRRWARTERGWFGCHGTTKDETSIEMEGEVATQVDRSGRRH